MRKAKAQRRHAIHRAAERYGLQLSRQDVEHIIHTIQAGRGTLIEKQSLRVSIFDVPVERGDGPIVARVVYDRERKSIASFLPR